MVHTIPIVSESPAKNATAAFVRKNWIKNGDYFSVFRTARATARKWTISRYSRQQNKKQLYLILATL